MADSISSYRVPDTNRSGVVGIDKAEREPGDITDEELHFINSYPIINNQQFLFIFHVLKEDHTVRYLAN